MGTLRDFAATLIYSTLHLPTMTVSDRGPEDDGARTDTDTSLMRGVLRAYETDSLRVRGLLHKN